LEWKNILKTPFLKLKTRMEILSRKKILSTDSEEQKKFHLHPPATAPTNRKRANS
jgi:hypothetical protein